VILYLPISIDVERISIYLFDCIKFVSLTGFIALYKMLYRREVKKGKKLKEQKGISQKEFLIAEV